MTLKSNNKINPGINSGEVRFSVIAHATWISDIKSDLPMPALLRRRASPAGKMALEAAYRCLSKNSSDAIPIPTLFCSRHGESERSAGLLADIVRNIPISPMAFSLSVHNATNGLFSIARHDHSNSLAIAAGLSTVEHAVIEACGLLADDAPAVLLVAYDKLLPPIYSAYQDVGEQPYAWAWLMQLPDNSHNISNNPKNSPDISLSWQSAENTSELNPATLPTQHGSDIFEFFIQKMPILERICNGKRWQWKYYAS